MYKRHISHLVEKHSIQSILIAFDNFLLVDQFKPFLLSLNVSSVNILDATFYASQTSIKSRLEKACVEMLSLAKTSHLLGNFKSTFLQSIYLFSEFHQVAYDATELWS
jgi:hypothetical protein